MSKITKTFEEKIANKDEQIQQLLNQKRQLVQKYRAKERKERNSRLCRRHGLLEKFMPDLINITDEQFEIFIKTGINTSYGKKRLAEIIGETAETTTAYQAETAYNNGYGGGANPPQAERSGA